MDSLTSTTHYPIGRYVYMGDIEGIITGVNISKAEIQYRVSYFDAGTYHTVYLYEFEFKVAD